MEPSMIGAAAPLPQLDMFGCEGIPMNMNSHEAPKRTKVTSYKAVISGDPVRKFSQLTLELLSLPLMDPDSDFARNLGLGSSEVVISTEAEIQAAIEAEAKESQVEYFGDNGTKSWSDNDFAILHEGLLNWQISQFITPKNVDGKIEAFEWVFSPDVYERRVCFRDDGTTYFRCIYTEQIPFTFQHCCMRAGYSAEALRHGLEHILRKRGLGELLEYYLGEKKNG